jgi:phage I-like protein
MSRILSADFRLPSDDWYPVERQGEFVNHASKVVQVIDEQALDAILNRFSSEATAENFAGLLIDYDHFSLDTKKPSEAAGWAMELRNRAGVLESRVRWTGSGRPKVEGGDFRFFSTVYLPSECEVIGNREVNGVAYSVLRPLRLDRLAVTNDPNNKGNAPISNRSPGGDPATNQNETMNPELLTLLGLSATASLEDVLKAVKALQSKLSTAETTCTEITNREKALKAVHDDLLATAVEADLMTYAGVIANRDTMKAQLLANRKGTLDILAALKPAQAATSAPITNRSAAKTPTGDQAATPDTERQRGEVVNAHMIANRCSFQDAWDAVRAAKPELFKS